MDSRDEDFIDDKFSIDQLIKRSWDYKNSDAFIKFFDFIAKFNNHYSRFNRMLVFLQNPEATFFGGISFWKKKFSRTINPQARAHVILVPFKPVIMVYDVFETSGKDSPDIFLKKQLGHNPLEVSGKISEEKLKFAVDVVRDFGIRVTEKPLSYFHAGYLNFSNPKNLEICLKKGMSAEQNLSFLMHELAHLFLGHTKCEEITYNPKNKIVPLVHRELTETVRELEAETVRYLICYNLGLETRSAEYMAGYIKSADDLIQFSYETVIKTADRIENLFIL